jgi:hypothetical protein
MTTVTPATEKKLRDAMQRLLAGKPQRTDGRLTKTNLHLEAGVSRATMNRANAVIADWNAAVSTHDRPGDSQVAELQDNVSKLKQTVAKLRQRKTELEHKNQAAVTVIAELHAQLSAARGAEPRGTITPLTGRQRRRHW